MRKICRGRACPSRENKAIKDHNPKYLLTMDHTPLTSHNGIKQRNVLDWLLGDNDAKV
ncbi:MAG: hypothetical protein LBQ96_02270 [Fusobacteriaceae bacterium]|nr:hypothetical protein [Fusobacteriaceae bacterium]